MACGSACCASPKALPAVICTPTLPPLNIDVGGSAIACKDECCQAQPNAGTNDCQTGPAKDAPKKDGSAARGNRLLAVTPASTDFLYASALLRSTRQAMHLQIALVEMAEHRVDNMPVAPGINISPNWKRYSL
ncbi:hypothetical protein GQ44DRAFT_634556 [Phaeosphaeriaceae sp. PMI808]|nr:hypothetical protein GQ44DRAFT_634556 [Phaeosphaeriaceae sp. PMI808]